ncbi:Sulfate transporter [Acetobacteraceae bacterium EV16G]|uniref:Sulfate transporter n=1 Tax=Sorlinia euscelidii TaxID=3081148 RepID=A0ABU7TYZ7_9PROT
MTEISPVRTLRDAEGRDIPQTSIRPEIVIQHDTAMKLAARFQALHDHVQSEKAAIFAEIDAFQALIFQEYNVKLGGRVGGLTLVSFDDQVRVETSRYHYQQLTPALPAAQALINEILDDLTEGATADLRALVSAAFQKDERTGRINVQRILDLKRLSLNHPKWPDAVRALNDAVASAGSKMAVRCKVRPEEGVPYEQIVVDFSRV